LFQANAHFSVFALGFLQTLSTLHIYRQIA
jgi:hypothetical protein